MGDYPRQSVWACFNQSKKPEKWSWGFPEEETPPVSPSLAPLHAHELQSAFPDLLPRAFPTCLEPLSITLADSCNTSFLSNWFYFSGRMLTNTVNFQNKGES